MSLHLVDDSGHLQPEKKITEFLESVAPPGLQRTEDILRAVGVNYHVVGVFGGQSSGKSTLLNTLFGTDFQTLDESVRRGQTTKGAFIGNADASKEGFTAQSTESPILVVDFEGTDGLERGEDQSFERQLSLFGLSMADTLIINMWAVDVGRFNAANLSLLRTIFEVNLQLFSHESYEQEEKPTLLVVLRDFTEDDPTPSITTVRKSFDTIWENIAKPSKFSDCSIDSLFLLKYYVMPHYKLQRNEFAESVTTLRRWFGDHAYPDYLFHHKAMFRGVPMDALPAYLTNCWEAIRTSKDLDIPTQREMLAQHRCKEVRELEMKNFLMFCRHYEERINRGEMLLRLSDTLDKEMEARLSDFHKHTRLYRSEVVAAHAQELEDALVSAAMTTMSRMASAVSTEVLSSMEARVQRVVDDCIHRLLKSAQTLPFAATTTSTASSAEESSAAAAGVEARSSYQMDSAGCQHLASKFWKTMKAELSEVLGDMSSRPPPTHLYGRYASLVAQDDTMRSTVVNTVTESIFKKVSARLASMAENAPETMHRGFERCLSHNPDGTVKFFATTKGLQQAVPAAEQAGMVLLGCLLYFRLELVADDATAHRQGSTDSLSARRVRRDRKVIAVRQNADERNFYFAYGSLDTAPKYPLQVPIAQPSTATPGEEAEEKSQGVTPDCILLNEQSAHRAFELFKQKCGFTVQLQLRSIEASKQRLPAWVIPALFILGFNELCYILTSPVLLVFIVVICVVFFQGFIVAQWQAFEETGPTGIVIPMQAALRYIAPLLQGVMAPAGHNNNNNNIVHEGHADGDASAARPTAMHVDPTTQAEQQPPTTIRRRTTEKED